MIARGKQLRSERETRNAELEEQKLVQDNLKQEKEQLKTQAEELEKKAIESWKAQQAELNPPTNKEEVESLLNQDQAQREFNNYNTNKDSILQISELQVDITLDRNTDEMPADILTKGLSMNKHFNCASSLGLNIEQYS